MIPVNFENIPAYLREQPRWSVWLIPEWLPGGEKPKKVIRLPSGEACPAGWQITKNLGTFAQVRESCKKDPRYYPALWLESDNKDGIVFLDYDGTSNNIPPVPMIPSYCERSVYGYGFHVLGWYKGQKPIIPKSSVEYTDEVYLGGRWIVMTGCIVGDRREINDLTEYLKKYTHDVEEIRILESFKVPVTAEARHPVIKSMVSSMVAKNYSFKAIVAACQEENLSTFKPPKSAAQIEKEVVSMYDWATKKQIVKEREKTEGKEAPEPKDKQYDFNDMADVIRNGHHVLSYNKTLYRYVDGVYVEDKGFLESEINRLLLERGIEKDGRVTSASAQVKHYLMYNLVEPEYPFNLHNDAFPVRNGVVKINFETGETSLIPFSPEYRFNYKLAVSYDGEADSTPVKTYLDSLCTDTDILLQIPAHAILSMLGRVYKKAYFLKGTPDSGKSTYIDMVTRRMFGVYVCSAISLQSLLNQRFSLAGLDGKIVNAYADLSDQRINDIGIFKALTGGDMIQVEKKGKDPYDMRNTALLVFSANKYPKITTGDDAFWNRWVSLEFEKSFVADPTFSDRTFTDTAVSGFLNLVLNIMKDIIKAGKIKTTDSVESKWLNDASSSHRFILDYLERCAGAVIVKDDLYQQYTIYCDEGEYEVEAHRVFTTAMKQRGALSVRPTVGGIRQHCYQGYKVKDCEPIYPDKEREPEGQQQIGVDTQC